jgi:predicted Fe-S protein YdhL (DUF1289 family)
MRHYRLKQKRNLRDKENMCAECVRKLATVCEWMRLSYTQKVKEKIKKGGD